MVATAGPTVRRRRLGIELRRLREGSELTIEEAARRLSFSASKVSRIETGRGVPRIRDVRDMLDLYAVSEEEHRELLLGMAKEAQQRGWWADYEDVLPTGFEIYVGLEAEAASLRDFNMNFVHGLLQTDEYARAILQAVRPWDGPESIDQLVDLRMRRQEVLTREPEPLHLWSILDESVVRRPIGGHAVLKRQLARLIDAATSQAVTVQVLPIARGAHAALNGSFTIIEFPERTDPQVVYVENPAGNIYLERDRDVRRFSLAYDHLRAAALPPEESIRLVRAVADEFDDQ